MCAETRRGVAALLIRQQNDNVRTRGVLLWPEVSRHDSDAESVNRGEGDRSARYC